MTCDKSAEDVIYFGKWKQKQTILVLKTLYWEENKIDRSRATKEKREIHRTKTLNHKTFWEKLCLKKCYAKFPIRTHLEPFHPFHRDLEGNSFKCELLSRRSCLATTGSSTGNGSTGRPSMDQERNLYTFSHLHTTNCTHISFHLPLIDKEADVPLTKTRYCR